jgi:hypothetical protein
MLMGMFRREGFRLRDQNRTEEQQYEKNSRDAASR